MCAFLINRNWRPNPLALGIYLGISTLLAACASGVNIGNPTIAPDEELLTYIEFSINRGYGLDANNNGIVDMPNSVEYVQRSLTVNLDFADLAKLYPSRWPLGENEDPGLGNLTGPWRWRFTPVTVPQDDLSLLPIPAITAAGGEPINDGSQLVAYTESPQLTVDLFEGDWEIEFARANPLTPGEDAIYWRTVPVTIEDYLIVQLGDSFSSGEGAPEILHPLGVWGDDGTVENYPILSPDFRPCENEVSVTFAELAFANHEQVLEKLTPSKINRLFECVIEAAFGSWENYEHDRAHRSSKTWGSYAAREIEDYDPGTSVTYINLAASGAVVDDLLNEYEESHEALGDTNNIVSTVYHWDKNLTSDRSRELEAQLDQLQRLIGKRKVDALVISIGGNDAGFSRAITSYVLRNPCGIGCDEKGPDLDDIEEAIKSGSWDSLGVIKKTAEFFGFLDFRDPLPGINGLSDEYHTLSKAFTDRGIVAPSNVYITEYTDPLVIRTPFSVRVHENAQVCPDPILQQIAPSFEIGPIEIGEFEIGRAEQVHVRNNLLIALNEQVAASANEWNWNLINAATLMYGRPICHEERMVNRYGEAINRQGEKNGAVHPNAVDGPSVGAPLRIDCARPGHNGLTRCGYEAVATALLRVIHLPNPIRDTGDRFDELEPPGDRYSSFPEPRFWALNSLGVEPPEDVSSLLYQPDWGAFGIEYSTDRVFLEVSPDWCEGGENLLIMGRMPVDYDLPYKGEMSRVTFADPMSSPFLRLVSYDRRHLPHNINTLHVNPATWETIEPVSTSSGVGGSGAHFELEFEIPTDESSDRRFYAVLSARGNATSLPVRGARVEASSSYNNDFGLVQLRTECGSLSS